jgi:hypothetical protein
VTDEQTKIFIALSYMRGQYADEFVQEYINRCMSVDPPVWGSWANFKMNLRSHFQNKTFKQETRESLEHFHQGKLSVNDYFTKLNVMFADAGLTTTTDAEKI